MSASDTTARRVAHEAMLRIEDGAYAHILVPQMLRQRRLSPRDRAFVTDVVYGSVRMQRAIDYLLSRVSTRPIAMLDAPVRAALRLGAYQLLTGTPAHAAVSETVNLVTARTRGFVNGVLRSFARTGPHWPWPEGDDVSSVGVRTSHPDWIVETLQDAFGVDDARATLELDNEPPLVTLRPNRLRTTPAALAAELAAAGVDVRAGTLVPDALLVRHSGDLAALPAIAEGRATPQDQTSQAIVAVLDPQSCDRVLDLASAPGGKATAAAERMGGEGLVVAADLHAGRARTVQRAAERVGVANVVRTIVSDGRRPPLREATFDRVLLDAPCSGLGVLRRRPDARFRLTPGDVLDLAALQRVMLEAAAAAVKPGGRLVYSVCTLTPEETLHVDAWAAEHLPDFEAEPPPAAPWRAHGRGALVLPSDANSDGMFVLSLRRAGDKPATGSSDVDAAAEGERRWHAVRSGP